MTRQNIIIRFFAFLMAVFLLLQALGWISIKLMQNTNPVLNYYSKKIYNEPENTIDVISIGSSDVYSSISPLEWWKDYGYTGFSWGEASQRPAENYVYLKKIYEKQKPKVVFLETATFFRDQSDIDNINTTIKAYLEQIFPVFAYHRFLWGPNPVRIFNSPPKKSVSKGYFVRPEVEKAQDSQKVLKKGKKIKMNKISKYWVDKTIELCEKNGSKVVLLKCPSSDWSKKKYESIKKYADKKGIEFLDLNYELSGYIDWDNDTCDGGIHMNYFGASKVTSYLGDYLSENCKLKDHRKDKKIKKSWNHNYKVYKKELERAGLKRADSFSAANPLLQKPFMN
ncbi:hypothetical protein SAMN05216249_11161 [Acetitomaculum ruminis DSM 5522]|uniref:SGNH/GDSL hydrolase family protein n=1 Tax=Acetitomaculum ruminis DSM 5522 TaxID=1120918 RepID=A0A1I0YXD2_9FIRM|nr:hypothetical protein [Acetitomaculum ruminis]SFB16723.1 hypothetical protein SAMN05216249_11161 [Acetitomaculum ruminis DSM 5522]